MKMENDLQAINDLQTIKAFKASHAKEGGLVSVDDSHFSDEKLVSGVAEAGISNCTASYAAAARAAVDAKAKMVRAYNDLAQEYPVLEKAMKEHVSKVNDLTGRVAQSLSKSKEIMGPLVEERLRQLERFVDSLERLSKLDADGVVSRFGQALTKK